MKLDIGQWYVDLTSTRVIQHLWDYADYNGRYNTICGHLKAKHSATLAVMNNPANNPKCKRCLRVGEAK